MRRTACLLAAFPLLAMSQPNSVDSEVALGRQLAAQVERDAVVIRDPVVAGYADRIARKLAATATLRTPLTIHVISGGHALSITLPGGFIEINTRLFLDTASEAELAGVMAHQLGHLVLWKVSPANPNLVTIPLLFAGGAGGLCVRGGVAPWGSGATAMALPGRGFEISRQIEAKADELGLEYMKNAGYDPTALADFYERIPKPNLGTIRAAFDPGLAMPESTRTGAESMRNARRFTVTTSEFEEVRRKVAKLVEAQVAVRPDAPSLKKKDGH